MLKRTIRTRILANVMEMTTDGGSFLLNRLPCLLPAKRTGPLVGDKPMLVYPFFRRQASPEKYVIRTIAKHSE